MSTNIPYTGIWLSPNIQVIVLSFPSTPVSFPSSPVSFPSSPVSFPSIPVSLNSRSPSRPSTSNLFLMADNFIEFLGDLWNDLNIVLVLRNEAHSNRFIYLIADTTLIKTKTVKIDINFIINFLISANFFVRRNYPRLVTERFS